MIELQASISNEIIELFEELLRIDADAGEKLPKYIIQEIDQVAKSICETAHSYLCE